MGWYIKSRLNAGGLTHFLALLFLPLSINILFVARKNHLAIVFLISRIVSTKTNGMAIIQKKLSLLLCAPVNRTKFMPKYPVKKLRGRNMQVTSESCIML